MRKRGTLTACLVLAIFAATLVVPTAAIAIDPVTAGVAMLLFQTVSDKRGETVERNTVSLSPMYNVYWDGSPLGVCPDTRTTMAAVPRGSTLVFSPGKAGRVDTIGVDMTFDSPLLPKRVALFANPMTLQQFIPIKDAASSFIDTACIPIQHGRGGKFLADPDVSYVEGHPRFAKWQIAVPTADLEQGGYTGTIRVYFAEKIAAGALKMGRKATIRYEESPFKFIVADREYMARAVNNPDLQQALKACFGLVGGPPSIGQLMLPLNPSGQSQQQPVSATAAQPNQPSSQPAAAVPEPCRKARLKLVYADGGFIMLPMVTLPSGTTDRSVLCIIHGGKTTLKAVVRNLAESPVVADIVFRDGGIAMGDAIELENGGAIR